MKNAMVKLLMSALLVAAALVPFQSSAQEGVFQAVAGNRFFLYNTSQYLSVTLISGTEMEEGVVSFQVFWSADLVTFEPLGDAFAATGEDGSLYAATYGCPSVEGPLYLQVVATLGDATTLSSEAVLVHDRIPFNRRIKKIQNL
jgi:hypothetical protein